MFFLDTCICIEFLRGTMPAVLAALRASDPHNIAIPSMVEAELRLGALKSKNAQANLQKVEWFLTPFETVPFDAAAAASYARIRADLERKGTPIGPNDLVIAATALSRGATLVTGNVREFERVAGLAVENWGEEVL